MFISWKKYVPEQGQLLRSQLERIVATQGLSKDVFELASKALV
jgi:aminopeptidase N